MLLAKSWGYDTWAKFRGRKHEQIASYSVEVKSLNLQVQVEPQVFVLMLNV